MFVVKACPIDSALSSSGLGRGTSSHNGEHPGVVIHGTGLEGRLTLGIVLRLRGAGGVVTGDRVIGAVGSMDSETEVSAR